MNDYIFQSKIQTMTVTTSFSRLFLFLMILHSTALTLCKKISGVYVDNGFDQSVVYEIMTHKQKINMRKEMLNFLDLPEEPPNSQKILPNLKKSAFLFLMAVYKMHDEDESARLTNFNDTNIDFFGLTEQSLKIIEKSDIVMSLATQNHKVPDVRKNDNVKILWFDVSQISPEDQIINAELRLYRSVANIENKKNQGLITIRVYRILTNRVDDDSQREIFVDAVNTTEKDGWVTLNITESLQHWVQSLDVNRGLFLAVNYLDNLDNLKKPEEVGIVGSKDVPEKQPFVVGYFKRTKKKVNRKIDVPFPNQHMSYKQLMHNPRTSICKKENLYISFEDYNWQSWIIAPRGYNANYCNGECNYPIQSHLFPTNHAVIQSLINFRDPKKVPKACCVPNKLSTIQVVYKHGDENFILRKYENMSVQSCGCH